MPTTAKSSGVKVRPIGENVVVLRDEAEETTPGGILLPEQAKEKPIRGRVLAVGSGHLQNGQRIPLEVPLNSEVIFARYSGTEIELDGMKYVVLREQDILAVVS